MNTNNVVIKNIILRGRKRRGRACRAAPRVCQAISDVLGEKLMLIDDLTCPYCLKQFKQLNALSIHIRRRHYAELMNDVEKVVELIKQRRR
jgi:hypothetical protein